MRKDVRINIRLADPPARPNWASVEASTDDWSEFAPLLLEHCKALGAAIVKESPPLEQDDEGESWSPVAARFFKFYVDTLRFQLLHPRGFAVVARYVASRQGKSSAESRSGEKVAFQDWAREYIRSTGAKKNEAVKAYTKAVKSKVSVKTLRKYLTLSEGFLA